MGATNFYPTQELTKPDWMTYGLGWFQHNYRGHKLDFHTGSIAGLVAIAGIIHDTGTAVYVLANRDHAELRHAILYKAMDLWAFNDPERPWHREIFKLYAKSRERQETALKKFNESQTLFRQAKETGNSSLIQESREVMKEADILILCWERQWLMFLNQGWR